MPLIARFLVIIEALICFGPLFFLLSLGFLLTPFWVAGLAIDPFVAREPAPAWDFIYPIAMVLLGILGIVALTAVVLEIVRGRQWFAPAVRRGVVAPGILAVLMFNWPWLPILLAGEMTFEAIWPLLIYFALPLAASLHLVWLASRQPN
jgi:hypothetical protein